MKRLILLSCVVLGACSTPSEKEAWQGIWKAKWEIDRNSPGYEIIPADYAFSMTGSFEFQGDQVTISANGFPKCVFQVDTSVYTQSWKVNNDTLELLPKPGEFGLQYKILEQTSEKIRLQLVDDIFITLTK